MGAGGPEFKSRRPDQKYLACFLLFIESAVHLKPIFAILAAHLKAECLAKKREHMILKTVRHLARVSARIYFKVINNAIIIKNFVKLYGIGSKTVLVAYIDGYRTIPPETSDVLINESEWSICSPFRKNVGLWRSILRGQVKIKRGILRVG